MDKAKMIAAETRAENADKGKKTKEQIAKEVKSLLIELRATTDGEVKKGVRRKLRARGHFGGLGERATKKTAKKQVVKNKRAKKAQTQDVAPSAPAHAEAA
jgi:hypothetical protein